MTVTTPVTANRMYKARLFEMIFSDKAELLKLYNAMNKSHYTDPEALEINTLENAIYMSMKNDLSFLIDSRLTLYEHQSTHNPNMPLRDLMYVADLYSGMTRDENLYGRRRISIPTPKFVVFYNGEEELPERMELKLSDSFIIPDTDVALELKTLVININPGYNEELLHGCKTLKDYSEYTAKVRKYAKVMQLTDAVNRAVRECIEDDVMSEYLRKYEAEVKRVSIYEYDEEKHLRQEREDERARMARLLVLLEEQGEADLILRALKDHKLLEELYARYQL